MSNHYKLKESEFAGGYGMALQKTVPFQLFSLLISHVIFLYSGATAKTIAFGMGFVIIMQILLNYLAGTILIRKAIRDLNKN